MSQQPPQHEPLVGEVRVKLPLPLAIPLGALILIGLLAWGVSRVFLAVPAEAATIIAIALAVNILGACAYAALKPRVSGTRYMEMLAIIAYPILIGVVIAQVGIGADSHATPAEDHPVAADDGTRVVADNIAFDVNELVLPANETTVIHFENPDSDRHNISIYEDPSQGLAMENALFEGEIIPAGDSIVYEFESPPEGTYYFQCDVHPNMNGDVTVQ
jgi:plastocyanin